MVAVVVGALGSVAKKLAGHLEQLGIKNRTRTMQKSALLGSAHILRKVLEVWGLGMRLDWIFRPRENPCAKFYIIIIIVLIIIIIIIIITIKQATVTFWLTYSKSNQASKESKKPKCVRESCYKAKYSNDGSRYVHGDLPAKLVAKWTHCDSSQKKANEYHRRSNSTVQAPLTYKVKLFSQKKQCKHVSGRA